MAQSNAVPGQRTTATVSARDCLYSVKNVETVPGVIDSTNAYDGGNTGYETELRPGIIMAQITSSKKWVPCKRTLVNGTGTVTALVVDDARAFKAGETITVGADTTLTVSAIDYTTNTMTIASTAVVDGEVVFCDSLAGSEIARCVLNEHVNLKDEDGTNRDKKFSQGLIRGTVVNAMVLGDLAAVQAATNKLNGLIFTSDVGQ